MLRLWGGFEMIFGYDWCFLLGMEGRDWIWVYNFMGGSVVVYLVICLYC